MNLDGYTLVLLEERYLWLVYILMLLMGGYLISLLFRNSFFNNAMKAVLLIIFVASFIFMPVTFLDDNLNVDKNLYDTANAILKQCNLNGNIATNDNDMKTRYLSFYMESNYLG